MRDIYIDDKVYKFKFNLSRPNRFLLKNRKDYKVNPEMRKEFLRQTRWIKLAKIYNSFHPPTIEKIQFKKEYLNIVINHPNFTTQYIKGLELKSKLKILSCLISGTKPLEDEGHIYEDKFTNIVINNILEHFHYEFINYEDDLKNLNYNENHIHKNIVIRFKQIEKINQIVKKLNDKN